MLKGRLSNNIWPIPTRLELFAKTFGVKLHEGDTEVVKRLRRIRGQAVHTGGHRADGLGCEIAQLKYLVERMIMAASVCGVRVSIGDKKHVIKIVGCVATFQKRQESDWSSRPGSVSCRHLEQVVDELNLLPHIRTAHPPRLPLPDHVHGLVALDRSPRRLKLTKPLLGFHASFDRSVILFQDVVQVLDWPVAATASQESFLFHP